MATAPMPGDSAPLGLSTAEGRREDGFDARAWLAAHRAELLLSVPTSPPASGVRQASFGLAVGRAYARALDDLLASLCSGLLVQAGDVATACSLVGVAGVGSYGRGAVALGSDLDVRLLATDEASARAVAERLLYPLWDSGLPVGHQVVAPDDLLEAAREDLPTATTLLDLRHVAGDRSHKAALLRRAEEGLFAHTELPVFLARLEREVEERHARFGGSVYLLEPDVKNAEGGLRDLDVARWAARARFGVGETEELVRVGALVPREAAELKAATEFLWQVRTLLHAHAGRRSDRLTFDEQESIAAILGYGEGGEAVERFMSDYYRTARAARRALERSLARAAPTLTRKRPRDEDLGGGVRLFDGCVTSSDAAALGDASAVDGRSAWLRDPALAFRLVSAAVDLRVPLLPFTRDAIATACGDPAFCATLRASPDASRRFVELVAMCKDTELRAGSVVRELHDTGLLLAMIPEFSPVVGRVHHDTYHVYTVDVHSVAAVDRLATLVRGELAAEFPAASRIAAEISRPAMLFFATLLHDVGKAIGGTDHSRRGAEMARKILTRLGLPPDDVDEACHLITKHLVMYHAATRRDLDDPETLAEFAREVHGREGLRDLYLLTVADLSTTSPTSMTSWKARMLDELFFATDRLLEERGAPLGDATSESSRGGGRRERAQAEALRAAEALPSASPFERAARLAFLPEFVASMPERYVIANAPSAIAAHAEVVRKHEARASGDASIALVPSRHPEAAEICVVADDRPGLLAAITAAIAASRLEVHAAEIHTRAGARGVLAVDLFWVRDRAEGVEGVARALSKLARDLHAVMEGEIAAVDLAHRRSNASARERKSRGAEVTIGAHASPRHTVIEVLASDRPGLLFAISDALYRLGLSIAIAKINTEGTRAVDVFYVNEADGSRIEPGARSREVRERLLDALASFEREGTTG